MEDKYAVPFIERAQLFGQCLGFTGTLKNCCQSRWITDVPVTRRCVSVGVQQYKCGDGTLVGHMATVLFPRSEIDSRVQSSWYFSKMDVSPRLGHFCQFVHRAARWHCACRRNEPDFVVSKCDTFPKPLSTWWEVADMEETCYGLMTRCRLTGLNSTKWIDFPRRRCSRYRFSPVDNSSLWKAKIWNQQSRSRLRQLTLPMYRSVQWL